QFLLWMGQQLQPDAPMYNMAFTFRFTETIDVPVFQLALQQLVASCDALRSRLVMEGEIPRITFLPDDQFELSIIDFSSEKEANQWVEERSQTKFDLTGRLFDTALLRIDTGYIWYLNQHHLITDGWSFGLLYQEFSRIYKILKSGEESVGNLLPTYQNFLEESVEFEENEHGVDYWKEKLMRLEEPALFYGKTNNHHNTSTQRILFELDETTSSKLRMLAQDKELRTWTVSQSLYTIFATIYALLIYRLTGEKQVTFGTPAHGRSKRELLKTIGLFIKIFPVAIQIEEEDSFKSLYLKMRNEINAFLKYSAQVNSSSELNHAFHALLNYINVPIQTKDGLRAVSTWLDTGHADPTHHIRLQIYDFNDTGKFTISIDLNKAIFDSNTQSIVVNQFQNLLDLFLSDKNASIASITESEKQQLVAFNETERAYPQNVTLPQLFEAQVQKTPQRTAILFEQTSLTYEELNQRANQLAHYLLAQGIETEDLIAICIERSLEMMIGLLGILKSGAAYVPLDPEYPKERINYMLEHCGAKHVITSTAFTPFFEDRTINIIDLAVQNFEAYPKTNPSIQASAENLMYVIYTSGSTGQPKGVMNQYSGVMNRLFWGQDYFQFNPQTDLIVQKTNYCFDVSVPELFLPIIYGVKLLFAQPNGHKDNVYLKQIINEYHITSIHFVPTMLEVFLLSIDANDCPSLRQVYCTGEILKLSQVQEFKRLLPEVELYNLYGPTEAAVEVTAMKMLPTNNPVKQVPIGQPISNTQLLVLDEQLRLCPIGVVGELYISGIQVARGYFNNEELTNKVFIKNPYGTGSYGNMYKTGDLAYWQADGNIIFLGRKDFQVKIRGSRVELEEIEAVIDELTYINQSVVLARTNKANVTDLVAYIAVSSTVEEEVVTQYLRSKLPDYMIPNFFVQLEEIPVNFNGKIDRKALSAMKIEEDSSKNLLQPSNDFEAMVKEVWMDVLQMEMSTQSSFFTIGGDSLRAIKAVVRLNQAFELQLPVNVIFKYPTIISLAKYIENTILSLLAKIESDS
ncbi:MAG: amino acid adenylation domain-containing protein, partial [Bacteroidota bacterium]